MKRYIKISIVIILIIFFTFSKKEVFASGIDDTFSGAKEFLYAGKSITNEYVNQQSLKNASDSIYNTFLVVGIILAVIVGIILALQFIVSGIEGKIKVKEALVPYLVGCVVVFGAFGIWKMSVNLFKDLDTYKYTSESSESSKCSCGKDLVCPPGESFRVCPKAGQDGNGKKDDDGNLHWWLVDGKCTCGKSLVTDKSNGNIYCPDAGKNGNEKFIGNQYHAWSTGSN